MIDALPCAIAIQDSVDRLSTTLCAFGFVRQALTAVRHYDVARLVDVARIGDEPDSGCVSLLRRWTACDMSDMWILDRWFRRASYRWGIRESD